MLQKLNPEPHLFVFDDVLPQMKPPLGRYVPIPDGFPFAGAYMLISPWAREPWKSLTGAPAGPTQIETVLGGPAKAGFVETHGDLPTDAGERRIWKDAHPAFIKAGLPDEYVNAFDTEALLAASEPEATRWGLGKSRPYTNKFGGFVRFPDSEVNDFHVPAWTWLFDADQVGATYQMVWARRFRKVPSEWHPGVPDVFREQARRGEF